MAGSDGMPLVRLAPQRSTATATNAAEQAEPFPRLGSTRDCGASGDHSGDRTARTRRRGSRNTRIAGYR
ncbi:MAG: hypothetical protein WCG47_14605, partial [Dermatophilaceae bacterium]